MAVPGQSAGKEYPGAVAVKATAEVQEAGKTAVETVTNQLGKPTASWFRKGRIAGALLVLAAAGCGNQYRPVVTPIRPTGPAPQPQAYAVVLTQPTGAAAGVATILDFSGDSVLSQVTVGDYPLDFTLDGSGATAYTVNQDSSLSDIPISTTVQTKNVQTSTLSPGAVPINTLVGTGNLYVIDQFANAVAVLTGTPAGLKQEIPVSTGLINMAGRASAPRFYAISQGVPLGVAATATTPETAGGCSNPTAVTTSGVVSALETSTNTISAVIPVGICPVYGISSADNLRTFVLNRGSNTITVINGQKNTLDISPEVPNGNLTVPAGPVYAELYDPTSQLVTANYDANSISVIDVSTDAFFNDSPQFGTIHTIPVGAHPTAVTVLQDGSRAYVANSDDGTISVVNLSSYSVEQVIPVAGHPRTIYSSYNYPIGKVYVASPDTQTLTIIRTDTNSVSATLQLQGNIANVRVTRQNADGSTQANNDTYAPGNGVPCTPGTVPVVTDACSSLQQSVVQKNACFIESREAPPVCPSLGSTKVSEGNAAWRPN